MSKLAVTAAVSAMLLAAFLTWKADAITLTGAANSSVVTKNTSLFRKTGCFLAGRYCGVGSHWVCGLPPNPERRRCHCVPC
jgi:hypothetical protein